MLKLLHLEDSIVDQELIGRQLRREDLELDCAYATDRESFRKCLDELEPDVILSDFSLPSFNGLEALKMAKEKYPDTPVIFVTGALGEERAVEFLKEGAADYVLKDRLQRLGSAIVRAREEADARIENRKAEEALRHRQRLEHVINRFSVSFDKGEIESLEPAVQEALDDLGRFIGAERICIYTREPSREYLTNTFEWARPGLERRGECRVPLHRFESLFHESELSKPLRVNSIGDLPPETEPKTWLFSDPRIESLLLVPISPLGENLGLLVCEGLADVDWSDETVGLINIAGEVLGNAIRRVDTERELREERQFLEKVLDFSEVLVVVMDDEGRYVRVNQGFTEITGYSPEESIGSTFDLVVADDNRKTTADTLQMVLEEGSIEHHETPIRTKDGGRRIVRWKADTLTYNGKRQILASGIDLTNLRDAEDRRIQMELKLAQAERIDSLGRVAANVAHEFNNVLMGIQPFAEVVGRVAGDDERLQICARQISRSIQTGTRITGEVLRFAQPAAPTRQVVSAGDWLRELVAASGMALGDGIEVVLSVEQEAEISIDGSQMEQVITNLLLNARDAMDGKGRIDIAVASPASDGEDRFGVPANPNGYAHIIVSDQGPGIPRDVRERLFEPFFTTKPKGTGLGLAVSHQIVRAHGGHLFVESEENQGSTFHLFLPNPDQPENDE